MLQKHLLQNRLSFLLLMLCALIGFFVLGCAAGDGDDSDDDNSGGGGTGVSESFVLDTRTDSNGRAGAEFDVAPGTTKFSVSVELESSGSVRFDSLTDDDDNDFLSPGGQQLSFGEDFLASINTVSAPSRPEDGQLDSSRRFQVSATAVSNGENPRRDVPIHFIVNSRPDNDFSGGSLMLNIFYVGDIGQDSSSKSAISAALQEFRRIYSAAGISLRVVERDISGSGVVPSPFDGSNFYASASAQTESPSVNVFVAGDVEDQEGTLLGISGGLPGPPVPSPRSAVVVSIVTGAGRDGAYDDEEIRLLGESMAHEIGHFMGLFHPIDFSGSSVEAEDPLSDTPSCNTDSECEANGNLVSNVMYPTPVFEGTSLIPQNGLTAQQKGVLNRYVAVD